MECLLMLKEITQMGEHFDVGIFKHLRQFFDPASAALLPYTVLDCRLKGKETSEYRSAYGQLCDWLYGWNVANSSDGPLILNAEDTENPEGKIGGLATANEPSLGGETEGTLQGIIDTFKMSRPIRDIDMSNENETQERDRILKVFETLLSITFRHLKKRQLQIQEEVPRVGFGLAALKVNSGDGTSNDFRDKDGQNGRGNELWARPNVDEQAPDNASTAEKRTKDKRQTKKNRLADVKTPGTGNAETGDSDSDFDENSDESQSDGTDEDKVAPDAAAATALKQTESKKPKAKDAAPKPARKKKVDDNVMVVKKRTKKQNTAGQKENVSHIGGFESSGPTDESHELPQSATAKETVETPIAKVQEQVVVAASADPSITKSQNAPLLANLIKNLDSDSFNEDSLAEAVLSIVKEPISLILSDLHLVLQTIDHATDYMLVALSVCILLMGFAEWQHDNAMYERLYSDMLQSTSDFVKIVLHSLWQLMQREIAEVDPIISTLALSLVPSNARLNLGTMDKQQAQKLEHDPFGLLTLAQTCRPVESADISDVFILRERLRHMGTLRYRWNELTKGATVANASDIGGPVRDSKLSSWPWTRVWRKLDLAQSLSRAVDIHLFPPFVAAHQPRRYVIPHPLQTVQSPVLPLTSELQAGKGALLPIPGLLSKMLQEELKGYCTKVARGGTAASEKPLELFHGMFSSDSFCADACFGSGKMEQSCVRALKHSVYDTDLWLSGGDDGCVRIHDLRSQKCIAQFVGHKSIVTGVAFIDALDGRIVSSSLDRTLKIWNSQGAFCERTLQGHTEMVLGCDVCKETGYIASASADNTVRLWDSSSGLLVATLSRHTAWVKIVKFTADGRYLVSTGLDDMVCVWDIKIISHSRNPNVSSPSKFFTPFTQQIMHLCVGKENEIAVSSRQGQVKFFDCLTAQELYSPINIYPSWTCAMAFSPDGQYIAIASLDNTISIFEVADAKRLRLINVVNKGIAVIEWVRDAKVIAKPNKTLGDIEIIGVEWFVVGTQEGFIQKILL